MEQKSYNPLKMWGSWVGVGIFTLHLILTYTFQLGEGIFGILIYLALIPSLILGLCPVGQCNILGKTIFTIIYIILGFLIGWGIHSLIRKVKK